GARAVLARVHRVVVVLALRGQLDDVAVRIAEVDRVDEAMVGEAARVDAGALAPVVHLAQRMRADLERDVEVVVVLLLDVERPVGRLEEGEAGAVVEGVEGVEHVRRAAALGLGDLEGLDQRQAEELLVEAARLLGVAAAVGGVVQLADHGYSALNGWSFTAL